MTTFVDEFLAGRAAESEVHEWVKRWHTEGSELQLHEFLGFTWPEFGQWAAYGIMPDEAVRKLPVKDEVLQGGEVVYAHGAAECVRPCPIHWPTLHHMRTWPQHWRSDRGIIERICTHGVGHPDPDDKSPDKTHGCRCGCCWLPGDA